MQIKREQYPFTDDRTKSELLKDILAMSNAWRTEAAFILVGIDENSSPASVVGVPPSLHFDDASLQQFVNGKTQQPVTFSYYAAEIESKSVGIIEIPVQSRPVFLKKDFGNLKANTVYLRRGSSTTIAAPDEVARMGASALRLSPNDLVVQFTEPGKRGELGSKISIVCADLFVSDEECIPDFEIEEYLVIERANPDYYRDLAKLAKEANLLRQAALTVSNRGDSSARDIRVELNFHDPGREWEFRRPSQVRNKLPSKIRQGFDFIGDLSPAVNQPGCHFEYLDGCWHLIFEIGYLQPGRTLFPGVEFYIGCKRTGFAKLVGKIMANELATPIDVEILIEASVIQKTCTLEALLNLVDGNSDDED